jgi:hypothetical protein
MKSADVLPFLKKKTVRWGKSASQYTQDALSEISAYIGAPIAKRGFFLLSTSCKP